jgi:2-hydroxy-3-oxopropionate reductase
MTHDSMSVGIIGLGRMGMPMARNLLKAGFPLTVWNRSRAPIEALAATGAHAAGSARDVAARSDVVITMLPDGPEVEEVLLGPDGVFDGVRDRAPAARTASQPGLLIIDMSTISPAVTRRLHGEAASRGCRMLDAPVSGGDVGAQAGTLSIMVGGTPADFAAAQPVFAALGRTITHCGPPGSGQLVKACNQIMVAIVLAGVSESLAFAQRAGVAPDVMIQVLQGGLARTQVMELRGARMAAHEFTPGFKASLHRKDLRIVLETARELGLALPFTRQVAEMLNQLVERGQGDLDNSALFTIVEEKSA